MSSLSSKSSNELCKLLDEYGINHGPIVDSTRKLYEKKLADAMARNTKQSSDKTYYREEAEEVTYVTYHPPAQHENFGDVTRRTRINENTDNVDEPVISSARTAYQSAPRARSAAYTSKSSLQDANPATVKSEGSKSGGVPGWLRVLVFIVIAVFLYYVYSSMESADENPFRKIDA